ncbi:MAG TPA: copper resistance protein CopC [Candidatus Ruania gallistercoris]|uniref:Copper resistance protein CopC n=1 Tax=Candidatus Ruania gallistercoris TaxID=2838746 RepID=A0A9D2J641_9MICO|nr:copper resistance protein CopC [Candidatus Ruania gallistercoris]
MAHHFAPTVQRRTYRSFPLLALVTFGALLLAGLTALPAAAHSTLLSSTPEDGAELDEAPDAVVLTFNENITDLGTDIVISGPDGEDVAGGETEIDGPDVSRALGDALTAGEYSVTWRAVSADGHPIDGELTFTLTEDAVAAGAGAEESSEANESEEPTSETPDDATASEDAGAQENGSDGSDGDQADADASDAADAQAGAGPTDDGGTSGGQIALFVVIGLAVVGGVAALIVRMRRQQ